MSTLFKLRTPSPEKVVQVSDSDGFTVRGLAPIGVMSIYKRHAATLSGFFERIMTGIRERGKADEADVTEVMLALFQDWPEIVAELIALGTGADPATDALAPDHLLRAEGLLPEHETNVDITAYDLAIHLARQLPMAVQLDALSKIGDLTFTSEMPVGKFAALVIQMSQRVTGAISQSTPPA